MTPYEETLVADDTAWHEAEKRAAVHQCIVFVAVTLACAGLVAAGIGGGPTWMTYVGVVGAVLNLVWDASWERQAQRARSAHRRSHEHVVADAVAARGDS